MPQPFLHPVYPEPIIFGGNFVEQPVVFWEPNPGASLATTTFGVGTLNIAPIQLAMPGQFTAADVFLSGSFSATNALSSQANTVNISVGVYSRFYSSLSLAASGSAQYVFTITGSSSSNLYQGLKALSVPIVANLAPGNYWYGIISSSSSAGHAIAAAGGFTNGVYSLPGNQTVYNGVFGAASAASEQYYFGNGQYSVSTSAFPTAIGISELSGSSVSAMFNPVVHFKAWTV